MPQFNRNSLLASQPYTPSSRSPTQLTTFTPLSPPPHTPPSPQAPLHTLHSPPSHIPPQPPLPTPTTKPPHPLPTTHTLKQRDSMSQYSVSTVDVNNRASDSPNKHFRRKSLGSYTLWWPYNQNRVINFRRIITCWMEEDLRVDYLTSTVSVLCHS